jgi:DNA-binding CsgD family transcriptional regulator
MARSRPSADGERAAEQGRGRPRCRSVATGVYERLLGACRYAREAGVAGDEIAGTGELVLRVGRWLKRGRAGGGPNRGGGNDPNRECRSSHFEPPDEWCSHDSLPCSVHSAARCAPFPRLLAACGLRHRHSGPSGGVTCGYFYRDVAFVVDAGGWEGALMADTAARLRRARELHLQSRWAEACDEFAAADRLELLAAEDLEAFAEAAQVLGRGEEAIGVLRRAYQARIEAGEIDRAVTSAFWLWQALIINAEFAPANGWVAQVRRLAQERLAPGVRAAEDPLAQEHPAHPDRPLPITDDGWLLVAEAYSLIAVGDYDAAVQLLARAAEGGSRHRETDLVGFATMMWGRALIKSGRLKEGLSRLDEAMLLVVDYDTSPRATSMLYCSAIGTCHEAREFARAREWTLALGAWLDSLPQLSGAYFGDCRIYRSCLMRLCGAWREALDEVAVVCDELSRGFGQRIAGHAFYELGEMHRLLGNPEAEEAYLRAGECGAPTQPGLAMLRLAQDDIDTAAAGIRRALAETPGKLERLGLLSACVTIMLAASDVDAARAAVADMAPIAEVYDTAAVQTEVAAARGAVALAEGDAATALPLLRSAARWWREIDAPHPVAILSVSIALACRLIGDEEAAQLELESARAIFARLGARPDLRRVETLLHPSSQPVGSHRLSTREIQVLRLIAAGKTNHAIATELFLSERTVHRHISNIFDKLGVHSRTAAASFAVQHHIVDPGILY